STLTQRSITSKEISIFSSRLNSGRFPLVIDWMEKGLIQPEELITHCMPLEQVKEAMEIFANDRKTCCKVLLQLG
ncbi:Zn-dependent oxidoreductase, partial [Acinetobacter baumannii]